ncbi:hypothetical protein D0Z07_1168 [Hyphodiscus hymeniophilus]|uniref:Btz domain-containing protein n=1 Tax=Hyphodiscus hymeniophilus TaxID=353542 RepID=A0A9P6VRF2_9HELO|nr:hypothetical protein D0Z07_1168 [Hyphodiscus hymeniophilus]
MAPHRRKDLAVTRRRVEDEGDEEGVLDAEDQDDDSLSEGSIISEEGDGHEDYEVVILGTDSALPSGLLKVNGKAYPPSKADKDSSSNGNAPGSRKQLTNGTSDMDMMLSGLKISEQPGSTEEVQYEDTREGAGTVEPSPIVVNSTAHMDRPQELPHERRRREHEEYKKKRDADPAFVPNRGAFFMHDHRHAGPAANGFRPFGRGRGRGRPGIGGPYAPINQMQQPFEPTEARWAHDMHEVITEPGPRNFQAPNYANGSASTASTSKVAPPNRALSTTKHIGNVQIRVYLESMEKPFVFPGITVKQYTRLPDHRPPLRRDKPVRISLPDHPPRYIFPAVDRSFIFIPRAMRPNQQGFGRGRGRSGLGSIGGYSRRTSVFGGSMYGSAYTPSVAMSRRSSLAREINRDSLVSPTGSTMSRPQMQMDSSRPVVKLPPSSHSVQPQNLPASDSEQQNGPPATSIDDLPRPQTYPLPQKPTFRENRPNPIPMHQPRPQKAVSVADIESPATLSFNPPQQQQQPFHQQVPVQVNGNGYPSDTMLHSRNPSYPSQASTGTPLSQIPERAIHAQPFQPHPFQPQSQSFYQQPYPVMQPSQQGYYYPQTFNQTMAPSAGAAPFVPAQPQPQPHQPQQQQPDASQGGVQNLVAQEVNGMVYYYDATQIPAVATFPAYQQPAPQSYHMQQVGGVMGGMFPATPSPDGFYYPQAPQGVVYYPQ